MFQLQDSKLRRNINRLCNNKSNNKWSKNLDEKVHRRGEQILALSNFSPRRGLTIFMAIKVQINEKWNVSLTFEI